MPPGAIFSQAERIASTQTSELLFLLVFRNRSYGKMPEGILLTGAPCLVFFFFLFFSPLPGRDGNCACTYVAWVAQAMCLASRKGHVEVVQLLLGAGASPSVADKRRWTPLHFAAWKGHLREWL